jgi:hypothetical protein
MYRPQQRQKPAFFTSPDRLQTGYAAIEIHEGFTALSEMISQLKQEISLLSRSHNELLLKRLHQSKKDYLTIEDVEELFDISKRTQQEERSAGKLLHLKKIEGNKILYTHQHIEEYLKQHYQEINKPI